MRPESGFWLARGKRMDILDNKKSFLMYLDYKEHLKLLEPEEIGQLMMALFEYAETGVEPKFSSSGCRIAFSFIRAQMDRDAAKYAKRCAKNKKNIEDRWGKNKNKETAQEDISQYETIPSDTNVYQPVPSDTKNTDTDNDNDTDNDTTPYNPPKGKAASEAVPYAKIIGLYNSTCISYPKVKFVESTRKKAIRARFKAFGGMPAFERLFAKAEASSFLKGNNKNNWSADFDWLIKAANMSKVLEGKYDDDKGVTPNGRDRTDPVSPYGQLGVYL